MLEDIIEGMQSTQFPFLTFVKNMRVICLKHSTDARLTLGWSKHEIHGPDRKVGGFLDPILLWTNEKIPFLGCL